jgi:hypothetical protein
MEPKMEIWKTRMAEDIDVEQTNTFAKMQSKQM